MAPRRPCLLGRICYHAAQVDDRRAREPRKLAVQAGDRPVTRLVRRAARRSPTATVEQAGEEAVLRRDLLYVAAEHPGVVASQQLAVVSGLVHRLRPVPMGRGTVAARIAGERVIGSRETSIPQGIPQRDTDERSVAWAGASLNRAVQSQREGIVTTGAVVVLAQRGTASGRCGYRDRMPNSAWSWTWSWQRHS